MMDAKLQEMLTDLMEKWLQEEEALRYPIKPQSQIEELYNNGIACRLQERREQLWDEIQKYKRPPK